MDITHPLTKPVPPLWNQPLETWEKVIRAAGHAERTVETRLRHVRQAARGLRTGDPRQVTSSDLLMWCGDQSWAPETRHSYYVSLRGFFNHLHDGEGNPAAVLPTVRRHPGIPWPTPEEELAEALQTADERTELILLLAAEGGLRPVEIAKVHKDDIVVDLFGYSLRVLGKGSKERLVPLEDTWLAHKILQTCTATGGYLFPGAINGHLSPRWVSTLATRALPHPWTLRSLRHRCATQSYRSGGKNIVAVQEILGHADLSTTRRYIATDATALREAIRGAQIRI